VLLVLHGLADAQQRGLQLVIRQVRGDLQRLLELALPALFRLGGRLLACLELPGHFSGAAAAVLQHQVQARLRPAGNDQLGIFAGHLDRV
jgi:hypothetical protein